MSTDACPYCAHHPSEGRGPTRDHVFVAALGGHARVTACRDCNSSIGHDVEGPLLKPGTLLNLIRQTRGTGHPLSGTLGDDQSVTYDLARQEIRSAKPVTVTAEGDNRLYTVRGNPDQVRRLLGQQGVQGEHVEALLAAASPGTPRDGWITTTVTVDLALSARLAAKTALGCGELACGDTFASQPLGLALREVLWARSEPGEWLDHSAVGAYDAVLADCGLDKDLPTFAPGPDTSQTLLVPIGPRRTGVLVHLAGTALGAGGLVIDAPLPAGHDLPVLIRDQPHAALIADVTAAILKSVATPDL